MSSRLKATRSHGKMQNKYSPIDYLELIISVQVIYKGRPTHKGAMFHTTLEIAIESSHIRFVKMCLEIPGIFLACSQKRYNV